MLWKISVMRMAQDVKRETLIVKRLLETSGHCVTAELVDAERFTALLPRCDRPAEAARRASHAPDRVHHQGVPDQFKNVAVAGAVAIGVGAGQIEAHSVSVGEDQLTLATAIGPRGHQSTGLAGI